MHVGCSRATQEFGRSGDVQAESGYEPALAAVRARRGRPPSCARRRRASLRDSRSLGIASQGAKLGFLHALEAASRSGDHAKAKELVEIVEALPAGLRPPFLDATAHRFRAHLAGDDPGADRHFTSRRGQAPRARAARSTSPSSSSSTANGCRPAAVPMMHSRLDRGARDVRAARGEAVACTSHRRGGRYTGRNRRLINRSAAPNSSRRCPVETATSEALAMRPHPGPATEGDFRRMESEVGRRSPSRARRSRSGEPGRRARARHSGGKIITDHRAAV